MTNFERIKAMTVEELAELISKSPCYNCKKTSDQTCTIPCFQGVKQWLESEVEE